MLPFSIRASLLAMLTAIALTTAGCQSESPEEMLQRALTDQSLSDSEAVTLAAKAIFTDAEVSTETANDGKVTATMSVHGHDESTLPPSVIDTAQGGINNAMKQVQLMAFIPDFVRFIEHARQRKLGEIVLTIKTPTFSGGKVNDWVDTYRLRISADRFEQILKVKDLDVEVWNAAAERIWKVEYDGFGQFNYKK